MIGFAFIVYPLDIHELSRRSPWAKYLPGLVVRGLLAAVPSLRVAEITAAGAPRGWAVTLPLTAGQMARQSDEQMAVCIIQAAKAAEKLGAGIIGAGLWAGGAEAVLSAVRKNLDAVVVTGSRYSLAAALEGIREGVCRAGLNINDACAAVIGADSPSGQACARLLAGEVKSMALVSRSKSKLEQLAARIFFESGLSVRISVSPKKALETSKIVVAAPGAENMIIPENILPGSLFCDLTPSRRAAGRVLRVRDDVLVMGSVDIKVPGIDNISIDACMAETMLLAMEGCRDSLAPTGGDFVKSVAEIGRLAKSHNYQVKTIYTGGIS